MVQLSQAGVDSKTSSSQHVDMLDLSPLTCQFRTLSKDSQHALENARTWNEIGQSGGWKAGSFSTNTSFKDSSPLWIHPCMFVSSCFPAIVGVTCSVLAFGSALLVAFGSPPIGSGPKCLLQQALGVTGQHMTCGSGCTPLMSSFSQEMRGDSRVALECFGSIMPSEESPCIGTEVAARILSSCARAL